ncbi:hypothetical protein GOP47_0006279 [Adiantum capillus-veneris]|uniref:Uncharacterized protein n=1 Tax=Adiantum capillus-veneris TaxID=13818 RepID=A0A9D4ZK57_ADICA|nr:hypothetical protein GOP47_0006279 [Adiantum capillus-veneris]
MGLISCHPAVAFDFVAFRRLCRVEEEHRAFLLSPAASASDFAQGSQPGGFLHRSLILKKGDSGVWLASSTG